MPEGFYHTIGRCNHNVMTYCEMAMEAYYNIRYTIDNMNNDLEEYFKNSRYIQKNVISTVVFSAMCIEAFFNDYIAVCIGDTDYYDNFVSLNPISKLKLICKFIFKIDMDKKQLYYSYTKNLFKDRNDYVHSKSFELPKEFIKSSPDEEEEITYEDEYDSLLQSEKHDYNLMVKKAEESLKAIKEIAELFDKNDNNIKAVNTIFRTGTWISSDQERDEKYRKYAFELLHLKKGK